MPTWPRVHNSLISISLENHQLDPIFVEDSQQSLTIYNYLFGEIQRGELFLLVILEDHPRAQSHMAIWKVSQLTGKIPNVLITIIILL